MSLVFVSLVASLYQDKEVCDIVIDNMKDIFGLHHIPGTEILKLLEVFVMRTIKMSVKSYVNAETWKTPKDESWCQENTPCD